MQNRRLTAGFTLLEILLVIGLIGVALAVALPVTGSSLLAARADSAMRLAVGELQRAHDTSLMARRPIEVRFVPPRSIVTERLEPDGRVPLSTTPFEYGFEFALVAGVPDTPDALGRAAAVDFGAADRFVFQPDGTLTDATGVPVNGTVFLAVPGKPLSARALTVFGTTGRVQPWRWNGSGWE